MKKIWMVTVDERNVCFSSPEAATTYSEGAPVVEYDVADEPPPRRTYRRMRTYLGQVTEHHGPDVDTTVECWADQVPFAGELESYAWSYQSEGVAMLVVQGFDFAKVEEEFVYRRGLLAARVHNGRFVSP